MAVGWLIAFSTTPERARQKGLPTAPSVDQYWAQTNLNDDELLKLLKDEVCFSEKRAFLACARALSQAAEKKRLAFSIQDSDLKMYAAPVGDSARLRWDEKTDMEFWSHVYDEQRIPRNSLFLSAWRSLASQLSDAERASVIASALNGFLSIFQDPHSYLLPLAYYENVLAQQQSSQFPLGFSWRRTQQGLIVRKVYPQSPAALQKLKSGDLITSINGQRVASLWTSELTDLMKSSPDVRLAVQRGKISSQVFLRAVQRKYDSVTIEVLGGSKVIPVVSIHRFASGTCESVRQKLQAQLVHKVDGVFLDLRDNPGGQVTEAACVIGLFVGSGTKLFEMHFLSKERRPEAYVSRSQPIYRGPLVVLVNSGSASAAEIVAGSLQDLRRAPVVGERTFGKGTFQDGKPWKGRSQIALFETGGMYYFPSGWTSQLRGVIPNRLTGELSGGPREEDLYYRPLAVNSSQSQELASRSCEGSWPRMASGDSFQEPWKMELENSQSDSIWETARSTLGCLF